MWEEATYLKYAASDASHSKFPEVFASRGRQRQSFWSALRRQGTRPSAEKRRAIVEPENVTGHVFLACRVKGGGAD